MILGRASEGCYRGEIVIPGGGEARERDSPENMGPLLEKQTRDQKQGN